MSDAVREPVELPMDGISIWTSSRVRSTCSSR